VSEYETLEAALLMPDRFDAGIKEEEEEEKEKKSPLKRQQDESVSSSSSFSHSISWNLPPV